MTPLEKYAAKKRLIEKLAKHSAVARFTGKPIVVNPAPKLVARAKAANPFTKILNPSNPLYAGVMGLKVPPKSAVTTRK